MRQYAKWRDDQPLKILTYALDGEHECAVDEVQWHDTSVGGDESMKSI